MKGRSVNIAKEAFIEEQTPTLLSTATTLRRVQIKVGYISSIILLLRIEAPRPESRPSYPR